MLTKDRIIDTFCFTCQPTGCFSSPNRQNEKCTDKKRKKTVGGGANNDDAYEELHY
jgi:hypothetical protein